MANNGVVPESELNSDPVQRQAQTRQRGERRQLGEARVEVGGEPAFVLSGDLDDLMATTPTRSVRLLGGFDQWVLGPGTDDPHVITPARRTAVSRQSGWIAPIVLSGGVVSGTWKVDQVTDLNFATEGAQTSTTSTSAPVP